MVYGRSHQRRKIRIMWSRHDKGDVLEFGQRSGAVQLAFQNVVPVHKINGSICERPLELILLWEDLRKSGDPHIKRLCKSWNTCNIQASTQSTHSSERWTQDPRKDLGHFLEISNQLYRVDC